MQAIQSLATHVGVQSACYALRTHRSLYYRHMQPSVERISTQPPLKLSDQEYQSVYELLVSPRFIDQAPASVVADLLDEGRYLCSERTMYRILSDHHEVKERRRGHRQVKYTKPELLASNPNELWSWDITKLKGPRTWTYYHLYVILDVYSRYVVGWMVADRESSTLAKKLIQQSCDQQSIQPKQLTLHADRGASMKSKMVAHLLSDLGVTKTHSRPHTSDDNPYSEAQFKTLKYRPDFPNRFDSLQQATQHCQAFFTWYNQQHKHSGIAMLTPESVHYGRSNDILRQRQSVIDTAAEIHPNRFKGKTPKLESLPDTVWINKPKLTSVVPTDCKNYTLNY